METQTGDAVWASFIRESCISELGETAGIDML
jgi:hypothetical protein